MSAIRWVSSGRGPFEVLGLAAIFALALGCPGSAQTPPPGETIRIDKEVTITFDGKTLAVQPEVFLARLGGPGVEFKVKGLPEKYTIEIDFAPQANTKGPFIRYGGVRGRYEATGTGKELSLSSGKVDAERVKAPSYWKYQVVVRDPDKNDLVAIDPGGVFK